jgi:tetratricopeptide (TPR) repeat protein
MDRIASLQRMLQNKPDDVQLHYFLSTELYQAKRYGETIPHVERYLELQPDDQGAAFRMLAISLFEEGRLAEAKQAFERGIVQAEKHNHPGMAQEFRDTIDELGL